MDTPEQVQQQFIEQNALRLREIVSSANQVLSHVPDLITIASDTDIKGLALTGFPSPEELLEICEGDKVEADLLSTGCKQQLTANAIGNLEELLSAVTDYAKNSTYHDYSTVTSEGVPYAGLEWRTATSDDRTVTVSEAMVKNISGIGEAHYYEVLSSDVEVTSTVSIIIIGGKIVSTDTSRQPSVDHIEASYHLLLHDEDAATLDKYLSGEFIGVEAFNDFLASLQEKYIQSITKDAFPEDLIAANIELLTLLDDIKARFINQQGMSDFDEQFQTSLPTIEHLSDCQKLLEHFSSSHS